MAGRRWSEVILSDGHIEYLQSINIDPHMPRVLLYGLFADSLLPYYCPLLYWHAVLSSFLAAQLFSSTALYSAVPSSDHSQPRGRRCLLRLFLLISQYVCTLPDKPT